VKSISYRYARHRYTAVPKGPSASRRYTPPHAHAPMPRAPPCHPPPLEGGKTRGTGERLHDTTQRIAIVGFMYTLSRGTYTRLCVRTCAVTARVVRSRHASSVSRVESIPSCGGAGCGASRPRGPARIISQSSMDRQRAPPRADFTRPVCHRAEIPLRMLRPGAQPWIHLTHRTSPALPAAAPEVGSEPPELEA
jgi:hypothetical protein